MNQNDDTSLPTETGQAAVTEQAADTAFNNRMDKPEPLIMQYDLKDWMNPNYTGSNPDLIARPALKPSYRGLQRRDNTS